jgi:hypothetical protein
MEEHRWTPPAAVALAVATVCIALVVTGCDDQSRQKPASSGVVVTSVGRSGGEAPGGPVASGSSPAVGNPIIPGNFPGPANSLAPSNRTAPDHLLAPGNASVPALPNFTAPKPRLNVEPPSSKEPGQGGDVLPPRRGPDTSGGDDRGNFNSELLPQNRHPNSNTRDPRTPPRDSEMDLSQKKVPPLVGKTAPSDGNKDQPFGATKLLPDPRWGHWKTTPSPGAAPEQSSKRGQRCGHAHQSSRPNPVKGC